MNDFDHFERRLAAGLRSDADLSIPRFDPAMIAHAAMARSRRPPGSGIRSVLAGGRPTVRLSYTLVAVALVLVLIVGAIAVGAIWHRQPRSGPLPSALFSLTGELQPREGHSAVRLRDGRVLVVGGGIDGSQAWVWDPATGSFSETGRMSTSRSFPVAVLLPDGHVLVAGGDQLPIDSGAVIPLASAELFDPATGTFHPTGSMFQARGTCHCRGTEYPGGVLTPVFYAGLQRPEAVTLADSRVFVIGGSPSSATPEIYDPRTGSFTRASFALAENIGDIGQPCNANRLAAATLLDGRVLVKCLDNAFLYDPIADNLTPTGTPTTDSVGAAVVLPDGRALFTGRGRVDSAGRAELFDPSTGTFRALTDQTDPLPGGTSTGIGSGTALDDGRIAFVDGSVARLFDPVTETFTAIAGGPLRVRTSPTLTLLDDGRVLIVGPIDPDIPGPQELLDPGRP